MDFDDTADQETFRSECLTWLDSHARRRPEGAAEMWRGLRPRTEGEDA